MVRVIYLVTLRLAALLALAVLPAAAAARPEPITVLAAASTRELLEEIALDWSRRSGIEVRLSFESSSTLARQIREGAACDLFVTADPGWLDGLPVQDRFDWLSNRLVLVVPADAGEVDVHAIGSLAIANEQVPAGRYARSALAHLGIALPRRTIHGQNVRSVLSAVSQGGAEAGVVYATDAAVDPAVRVAMVFPAESHPPILYVAALVTPAARSLYDALREESSLEIARRHGFIEPR